MSQLRLSIHSQTPFARFLHDPPASGASLAEYAEGRDYVTSPGGVTRMVDALLRHLTDSGRIEEATWTSLGIHGPPAVRKTDHVVLRHVRLADHARPRYAAAKGKVWNAIHGLEPDPPKHFPAGFDALARVMGRLAAVDHMRQKYDAFYVHDFQLLQLGALLPRRVPRLFRWHVPVPAAGTPLLPDIVGSLNRYDSVVVSTRRYAAALRAAGVVVPIHASYPYLDETRPRVVTDDDIRAVEESLGLGHNDVVFAVVARLDPMKSHDVAIRALARVARGNPNVRLVLVGGGGFSAGAHASLGLSFATEWRATLERLAEDAGVADRVIFAGNLSDAELDVVYTRARAVLLPSNLEGFGLAAVEGWIFGRPVLVSRGAGVSELVEPGTNGFLHDPGDHEALASGIERLAADPALAKRMGEAGRKTARLCHRSQGAEGVSNLLEALVTNMGDS